MGDARQNLHDAAVLWVLDGEFGRVVDAAVACIEAGVESGAVDVLAGSSPSDPYSERQEMVTLALDELELPAVPSDPDDLAHEGALILARSVSRGDLTRAGIGSWMSQSLTCETRERVESALDGTPQASGVALG